MAVPLGTAFYLPSDAIFLVPRRDGAIVKRGWRFFENQKILPDLYYCSIPARMFVEPYVRMYKQMEVEPRRKGKHFTQDERAKI